MFPDNENTPLNFYQKLYKARDAGEDVTFTNEEVNVFFEAISTMMKPPLIEKTEKSFEQLENEINEEPSPGLNEIKLPGSTNSVLPMLDWKPTKNALQIKFFNNKSIEALQIEVNEFLKTINSGAPIGADYKANLGYYTWVVYSIEIPIEPHETQPA